MRLSRALCRCTPASNAGNPLPDAIVLRKHYYFGFRPARTYLYSEFDSRSWSAHLGMGNETAGYAIAGASHLFPTSRKGRQQLAFAHPACQDLPVQQI